MKSNIDLLKSLWIKSVICIFIIFVSIVYLKDAAISKETLIKCLELSILSTSIVVVLFEKFFWKYLLTYISKYKWIWAFFEKYECPILREEYICLIKYEFPIGSFGEKQSKIKISQTYTSVTIELITDEIKSRSLTAEIINENGEFVLYYNYRTTPKAQFLDDNKPQYGGARIVLDSITDRDANNKIEGIYWTTSKTKGDIFLS